MRLSILNEVSRRDFLKTTAAAISTPTGPLSKYLSAPLKAALTSYKAAGIPTGYLEQAASFASAKNYKGDTRIHIEDLREIPKWAEQLMPLKQINHLKSLISNLNKSKPGSKTHKFYGRAIASQQNIVIPPELVNGYLVDQASQNPKYATRLYYYIDPDSTTPISDTASKLLDAIFKHIGPKKFLQIFMQDAENYDLEEDEDPDTGYLDLTHFALNYMSKVCPSIKQFMKTVGLTMTKGTHPEPGELNSLKNRQKLRRLLGEPEQKSAEVEKIQVPENWREPSSMHQDPYESKLNHAYL